MSGQVENVVSGCQVWGVAHVRPYQADLAMGDLRDIGLSVFFPRIKTMQVRVFKRQKTLKEPIVKPMFPGYAFVGWRVGSNDWARAKDARGVSDLIRTCGKHSAPSTVPSAIMAALLCAGEILDLTVDAALQFDVGEIVEVKRAGFEDQLFKIARLDPRRRIRFILQSMNPAHGERELKASAEDLKKVAA